MHGARGARDSEDALVRAHLPLVHYLVAEMSQRIPAHVSRDDLESAGIDLGKLMSGNKFLDRLYEVTVNGTKMDKPAFDATLEGTVSFKHKQLSSRTKITPIDLFMKRIFDDFLGVVKAQGVSLGGKENIQ